MAGVSEVNIEIEDYNGVIQLVGNYDGNIRLIETAFGVEVLIRGTELRIIGIEEKVLMGKRVIDQLINMIKSGTEITEQTVIYTIESITGRDETPVKTLSDVVITTARGKVIKCKTIGQKKYVEAIRKNDIIFGIGPAGTGKTYLAMALAVKAFKNREVSRIILTRPAVEAGEKLGFLPGDLQMKVDPYLRPLYDALHDIMGAETYQKHIERGVIEIAPLAYMRGRTLDDAYVILDEAQNSTPEQMKMFLTRLGYGSKAVITGDITQTDLPRGKFSGLKEAMEILKNIEGIDFCYFSDQDVVRHRIVKEIINAYERHERELERLRKERKEESYASIDR